MGVEDAWRTIRAILEAKTYRLRNDKAMATALLDLKVRLDKLEADQEVTYEEGRKK